MLILAATMALAGSLAGCGNSAYTSVDTRPDVVGTMPPDVARSIFAEVADKGALGASEHPTAMRADPNSIHWSTYVRSEWDSACFGGTMVPEQWSDFTGLRYSAEFKFLEVHFRAPSGPCPDTMIISNLDSANAARLATAIQALARQREPVAPDQLEQATDAAGLQELFLAHPDAPDEDTVLDRYVAARLAELPNQGAAQVSIARPAPGTVYKFRQRSNSNGTGGATNASGDETDTVTGTDAGDLMVQSHTQTYVTVSAAPVAQPATDTTLAFSPFPMITAGTSEGAWWTSFSPLSVGTVRTWHWQEQDGPRRRTCLVVGADPIQVLASSTPAVQIECLSVFHLVVGATPSWFAEFSNADYTPAFAIAARSARTSGLTVDTGAAGRGDARWTYFTELQSYSPGARH